MLFIKSIFKENTLFIFLILAIIIIFSQFTLLDSALKIGFKPDDWILYFSYKLLGAHPLSKLLEVWKERGIYTTYQVYYMWLLDSLVGFDYHSFQILNLSFKVLGTLAVFPLVMIVFKKKILAILTTLLYAVNPSTIGSLEFVVKGSDYLAIFWLCLFLSSYYLVIEKYPRNFLWIGVTLTLFFLSLIFSPIRIFPILVLLPLIEAYLLIRNICLSNLKNILLRILIFYLPLVIVLFYAPDSIAGLIAGPIGIFKSILNGNWHLILAPFSGIGDSFITNDYWGALFGVISTDSLEKYILFLLGGPSVIFGVLTLIWAFLEAKRPWLFWIFTFVLNFLLEVLVFFMATHSRYLPAGKGLPYDQPSLYSALSGIYILVLGFVSFIEWIRKKRENNLLLAFWIGSFFLFIFTFVLWLFAPFGTSFSSTSYYLVVSSLGSSLSTAVFLFSISTYIMRKKRGFVRIICFIPVLFLVVAILRMDLREINIRFDLFLKNGRAAQGQQLLQNKFRERLGDFDNSKPSLFYFDTNDLSGEGPFYSEGFLGSFPFWMHFQENKLTDGCLEMLYLNEHKQLIPFIKEQNGQKGFFFRGLCVENGKASYKDIFYTPNNFYAFKIKNRDFINIKKELLKELDF